MTKFEIYTHAMALSADERIELIQALVAVGRTPNAQPTVGQPIASMNETATQSKPKRKAEPKPKYIELKPVSVKGKKVFFLGSGRAHGGAKLLLKSVGFVYNTKYADGHYLGAWEGTAKAYKELTVEKRTFHKGRETEHEGLGLLVDVKWLEEAEALKG